MTYQKTLMGTRFINAKRKKQEALKPKLLSGKIRIVDADKYISEES